jgi:hypothetical protein
MTVRLAAEPAKALAWQIDAVIGDGIVGMDLVGRAGAASRPAGPAAPAFAAPPTLDDPRLEAIREQLAALVPGDQAGLMALSRTVADAAGAECVLYNVLHGDAVETAVGWRLPPS